MLNNEPPAMSQTRSLLRLPPYSRSIHHVGRDHVFHRDPDRLEERDFLGRLPPGPRAGNHLPDLRDHLSRGDDIARLAESPPPATRHRAAPAGQPRRPAHASPACRHPPRSRASRATTTRPGAPASASWWPRRLCRHREPPLPPNLPRARRIARRMSARVVGSRPGPPETRAPAGAPPGGFPPEPRTPGSPAPRRPSGRGVASRPPTPPRSASP